MLKLLLDTPFIIGAFVCILFGLSGCSNLPAEKELPVIGTVNVPFASKARNLPATIINQQNNHKPIQRLKKPINPSEAFTNPLNGTFVWTVAFAGTRFTTATRCQTIPGICCTRDLKPVNCHSKTLR